MPVHTRALHLGHEDHRAPVAAATGDEHLTLGGDAPLGADELGLRLDAARHLERDATAIDDGDLGIDRRVAVDAIAGEAR